MENGADREELIHSMPSWPLAQWKSEAWLADGNRTLRVSEQQQGFSLAARGHSGISFSSMSQVAFHPKHQAKQITLMVQMGCSTPRKGHSADIKAYL